MVGTPSSQCRGSKPGLGTKIPHVTRHSQKVKKKEKKFWLAGS